MGLSFVWSHQCSSSEAFHRQGQEALGLPHPRSYRGPRQEVSSRPKRELVYCEAHTSNSKIPGTDLSRYHRNMRCIRLFCVKGLYVELGPISSFPDFVFQLCVRLDKLWEKFPRTGQYCNGNGQVVRRLGVIPCRQSASPRGPAPPWPRLRPNANPESLSNLQAHQYRHNSCSTRIVCTHTRARLWPLKEALWHAPPFGFTCQLCNELLHVLISSKSSLEAPSVAGRGWNFLCLAGMVLRGLFRL